MQNFELLEKLLSIKGFVVIIVALLICRSLVLPIIAMIFNYSYSSKSSLKDGSFDLTLNPSKKKDQSPDEGRKTNSENDESDEIN